MAVASILTNVEQTKEPNLDIIWKVELEIGKGTAARSVQLDLPPAISTSESLDSPLLIANGRLVFFRDQLFMPERPPKNGAEHEEIVFG